MDTHAALKNNEPNLEQLWAEIARSQVSWFKPWDKIMQGGFTSGDVQWFAGAKLNVSFNCLDRHLLLKGEHTALIWEGDDDEQQRSFTFRELHAEVCCMANVLKLLGITKGDKVAIYLPMIPEAVIAMLACARIGAIHTVIFAGFSAISLEKRLEDASCKLIITADGYQRGGKLFALKPQVDQANQTLSLQTLLIKNSKTEVDVSSRDFWWHELKLKVSKECAAEPMDAEDPLFILYTSGSTGKPKGLVHTTAGYLVQVAYSHQYVFNCAANEVFWCTADVGWITGHSYVVYGPLCNGITTVLFAGIPTWPNPSRCWEIIDKYKINVFYTAPTAIRRLQRAGDEWLAATSRQSLRLLGSVGEPINPAVWQWYHQQVGLNLSPIVDTWWQTETGAIMLSPQTTRSQKPGAAGQPLPGIYPVLLDEQGHEIPGEAQGKLAIKFPWPAMARTIVDDHARFCETYLFGGYYLTGDGARRDPDGDYWITGRMDDVLNVSGHRLGTAEIENVLTLCPQVTEAAVVGVPHAVKGEGIYAFVSLKKGFQGSKKLQDELIEAVKKEISAIAKPDVIQWVGDLPKTRSGKIMRRILRQIASKKAASLADLGDLSTLSNPQVVKELFELSFMEPND